MYKYNGYFKNIGQNQAYVLGMLTADGHVHKNRLCLALMSYDSEIVMKIRTELGIDTDRKLATSKAGMVSFSCTSSELISDLAKYNICPAKTFKTEYPTNLPQDMFIHYLRGLIDGDGSFGLYQGQPCISVRGTDKLLSTIHDTVISKYGIDGSFHKDDDSYKIVWYKGSIDLGEHIYTNANLFMSRKHDKFVSIRDHLESTHSYRGRLIRHALKKEDVKRKYVGLIRKYYIQNNRTPTANEFKYIGSYATMVKCFDSFNGLISAAGYTPRDPIKVMI